MSAPKTFDEWFVQLTGQQPFPWQELLYREFAAGKVPSRCDLPTGIGKTSVIAVWLIARILHPEPIPRRLVYVVNRRTVVDQTTVEVERLRASLEKCTFLSAESRDLAVSTLRGQYADKREWSADPSRPAVICGTVDMIGSRLLFSGYGVGFKARPLHAGFLGQDALLVHDESHLEPAFQNAIEGVVTEQQRCGDWRPLRVMALSATARNADSVSSVFSLSDEDLRHPVVGQRLRAHKAIHLDAVDDEKKLLADAIVRKAMAHAQSGRAVLVFANRVDDVGMIVARLRKDKLACQQLTGTLRGFDRDALAKSDPVFQRFLPEKSRSPTVTAAEGTVYLVCTSAGEVGVDMSADHLVSDLTTFERMAQRFGRVNRYGLRDDSRIDVVYPESFDADHPLTPARKATLDLLRRLDGDASPFKLGTLDASARQAAFTPPPRILPVTDILFDAWSLTSIREPLPGRPPVAQYLHGQADWEPPETQVAWREEVGLVAGELLAQCPPADLLDDYPLKPHELLRDRSDRVFKHLETLAKRHPDQPTWILDDRGDIARATLRDLADKQKKERINNCTVLLPPAVGGLSDGMLDGGSEWANDVSDVADGSGRRIRIYTDDPELETKTAGMRRVRSISFEAGENDDDELPRWDWYESLAIEGGRSAARPVLLTTHVDDVVNEATRIVSKLRLPPQMSAAIIVAARLHDHGKRRERFQVTLGNREYPGVLLAKAGRNGARLPEAFRHEFASLLDAQEDAAFQTLEDDMQDLVLHLIAAHHGRGRPHFNSDEAFDPNAQSTVADTLAIEVPRRFARLQRTYGRWGLAYLESLLRAADWAASAAPSAYAAEPEVTP
jgi:CRISPR-associated endonuclease/helicase Cas3